MARRTTRIRSSRRAVRLDFGAIEIVGGLLTPDIIARIAAFEAKGQDDESYRVPPGLKIRDEIARYFRMAEALWAKFAAARAASPAASEKFVLELLQQCFGFDSLKPQATVHMGEREFPVRHAALSGRVPVVIAPVPPAAARRSGLDESLQQFSDGARRRSATLLLQEYLNASEEAAWGVALDGTTVRLMRDNVSLTRPAWIEADLERIFSEGLFPDFSVLWLLIHQSRFGNPNSAPMECSLEQWRDIGRVEGVAARDKLRRGVEAALIELGQGFLEHQANGALRQALIDGKLSRQAYFEELLRLIYRLIFLFAAEDRQLLHTPGATQAATSAYAEGYSLSRLRERCMRRTAWDRHGDAWEGLKAAFAALGKGQERLGLPALGGLFASEQLSNLNGCKLDNRHALAAIWRLAWMRPDGHPLTRVNWRDMETEELGSVYESLLELTPIANADTRTFTFAEGDETRGNARKVSGSYYTPDSLVEALLDESLNPLIEETVAGKDDQAAIDALLNLRIIDPACGSGHFLLAAARRLASRIARLSSPGTPSEADYRHWLREVARRCLFGVDRNPMAIELAKVALWIETVEPGRPLSFLDAHLRCGDSLLGVYDLKALEIGIPDDAYKPLTGDDRAAASAWKKLNKQARERDDKTIEFAFSKVSRELADTAQKIETQAEDDLAGVEAKRKSFEALLHGQSYWRVKTACDLYIAAFLLPKTKMPDPTAGAKGITVPTTSAVRDKLAGLLEVSNLESEAVRVATAARAFHWPLEFPQVFFPSGGRRVGFDLALGNPPWERIKLQEQEYFASRDPNIANARNAASRRKLIEELAASPKNSIARGLYNEFAMAKRLTEASSTFSRIINEEGGRYPLTGTGDVNTYALFAELFLALCGSRGYAGFIVPSGIMTDLSTAGYFNSLMQAQRLFSALSFENEEFIFPSIHNAVKFAILSIGPTGSARNATLAFFLRAASDCRSPERRIVMSNDDIFALNPNTRTAPTLRGRRDRDLVLALHSRVGVLVNEAADDNPWGLTFIRLYDMATDSHLFDERSALLAEPQKEHDWVPLYEGKLFHHFNHRHGDYRGVEIIPGRMVKEVPRPSEALLNDPAFEVQTRYWVKRAEFERRVSSAGLDRTWLLGWRDICRSVDERTVIACVLPKVAVGHTTPLIRTEQTPELQCCLYANLCSLVLDYAARLKVGGTHLTYSYLKQFPLLRPEHHNAHLPFILPRVVELTFTSESLRGFAADVGYGGPTFSWNMDRRALLRAELDAKIAALYGLTRDQLRYILDPADICGTDYPSETFRVLKNNEIAKFGEYRTGKLVLEAFDQLTAGTISTEVVQLDALKVEVRTEPPKAMPLADGAWSRPKTDARGEYGAQLVALLKALQSPLPMRQFRLAAILALEPRLLVPALDKKQAAEWRRLVGADADPLPEGAMQFVPSADQNWGHAVRGLHSRGNVTEDTKAGTWGPGKGLDKIETEGWPEGRAEFVLDVLRKTGDQPAVDTLPKAVRRWVDAEAA